MVRTSFFVNLLSRHLILRCASILFVALLLAGCGKGGEIYSLSPGEYVGEDSYGNTVDIVLQTVGSELRIAKLSITFEPDLMNPVTVESGRFHQNAFGIVKGGRMEFVLLLSALSNSITLSGNVREDVGLWGLLFGTPQEELVLSLEKPNREVSAFKENLGSGEIDHEVLKHLRDKYEFVLNSKR